MPPHRLRRHAVTKSAKQSCRGAGRDLDHAWISGLSALSFSLSPVSEALDPQAPGIKRRPQDDDSLGDSDSSDSSDSGCYISGGAGATGATGAAWPAQRTPELRSAHGSIDCPGLCWREEFNQEINVGKAA